MDGEHNQVQNKQAEARQLANEALDALNNYPDTEIANEAREIVNAELFLVVEGDN